jgi:mercuric reductase
VPSKALLRAAETFHAAGHHPFAGVETEARTVDLAALAAQNSIDAQTTRAGCSNS